MTQAPPSSQPSEERKVKLSLWKQLGLLWQNASDLLFGYDYFIAHRSKDGKDYAQALHHSLTEKGNELDCFLDAKYFMAGGLVKLMQTRALKSTTRLAVIVTPLAKEPTSYLLEEVKEFKKLHPKGIIAPIIPKGYKHLLEEDFELKAELPIYPDQIWIIEDDQPAPSSHSPTAGQPTPETVAKLMADFAETRRSTWRQRWLKGVAACFAALAAVACWQAYNAETARKEAVEQRSEAISSRKAEEVARQLADHRADEARKAQEAEKLQRQEAERQKKAAQLAQGEAQEARIKAEENAAEATRQKNISQSNLARSNMQRALTHLVNQEWEAAQALLRSIPQEDRQWEWRFLSAWCGPSTQAIIEIPLEGPYKSELDEFRKIARMVSPEHSGEIEEPLLPTSFGSVQPFVQLSTDYQDESTSERGKGWVNGKKNIAAGRVQGGGRPGSLVAVLRADKSSSGTLIDSIATSRYGEVWAYIPSQDGSMLFYGGEVDGSDGSIGKTKSKRAIKDHALFPLGDVFGITWAERVSNSTKKLGEDDKFDNDPLDLRQVAHPWNETEPGSLRVAQSASPHEFWLGKRALFWKGDGPAEAGTALSLDPDIYTGFEVQAPAKCLRATPVLERLRLNRTKGKWFATETVISGERCLVIVSVVPETVYESYEARWEAWDADTSKKLWTRPDPIADAIAVGDSATHPSSDRLAVYPSMDILSISTGEILKKLAGSVHVEGGAWFNPSLSFTPNGRFLVFYGEGRNDVDFAVWDTQSGDQLVSFSGLYNYDDNGNRKPNSLPDNVVFKQLGVSIPYVLGWERSGKFIVLQKTKDQDVVIYDDLGGKEITRFSGLNLTQDWYAREPINCVVDESLDRLILGPYLIKASTWEILLQFPESMVVSADWSRVAVPFGKDSIELVRVPKDATPASLREYLMMQEFGWK